MQSDKILTVHKSCRNLLRRHNFLLGAMVEKELEEKSVHLLKQRKVGPRHCLVQKQQNFTKLTS